MARFFINQNNGVKAVVSEQHAKICGLVGNAGGDPIMAGVRIFTFCSPDRFQRSDSAHVFTGDYDDLELLIENGGHELVHEVGDWGGFVPFSNGAELGIHGEEAKTQELRFRTTLRDVINAFGVKSILGS